MFYMARSYSRPVAINTEDLLTALKNAANYEAELFINNKLISSPFGFSQEVNEENLLKCGITTYVKNNRICYKYTDESKNIPVYFATFMEYDWAKEPHLQVHVHDYSTSKNDVKYNSLEEIYGDIKKKYPELSHEAITIGLFDDNGYTSLSLQ